MAVATVPQNTFLSFVPRCKGYTHKERKGKSVIHRSKWSCYVLEGISLISFAKTNCFSINDPIFVS